MPTRHAPEPTRRAAVLDGSLTSLGWAELRFRAMGTQVHLAALGEPGLLVDARHRIEELEDRWSRFRPDSLLCLLNGAAGRTAIVDEETFDLVVTAVGAWHGTDHRFDPTVLDAVSAAGYDRSFELVGPNPTAGAPAPGPTPGCSGIALDPDRQSISLPAGVHLDLGGIAKGRTADLVATELVAAGARSAMANLGGDLRIAGEPPAGGAFSIVVEDPTDRRPAAVVVDLAVGALATSSRARRAWTVDGEARHHLIDPATGQPAAGDVLAATVIAGECTQAEVLAKAALVAGRDAGAVLLADAGVPALLIDADGDGHPVGDFQRFAR